MTKRLRVLSAATVFVVAALWAAVGLTRLEVDSDLGSLLPADDPAVTALDSMAEAFGGDPVVVLVEGGGDPLGQRRVLDELRLEGALSQVDGIVATYGPATTLNQTVLRIKEMIADLSGQRDALRQAGLTRQLKAFDERYGALLVDAMPAGLPTLSNPSFVSSVVRDARTQEPKPQWRQYLPAPQAVAIYLRPRDHLDQDAARKLTEDVTEVLDRPEAVPDGARVTVTGVPVVSTGLAERMRTEVPLLAGSAFLVVATTLLLVPWTRRRRDRLAPIAVMAASTACTLAWFGWRDDPLSIGAATFLPIILGLGTYYPVYLLRTTHRRVVLAVAVSAGLAFAGLSLSPLPFVRQLGTAVPLGLALVVSATLIVQWVRGARPQAERPVQAERARRPRLALVALGAVVAIAASVLGWAALPSTPLQTDPQQLLAGLPQLEDAVHVEDVLGFGGEVDVRLRGDDVLTPEALAWSRRAEQKVVAAYGDRMHPVVTVSQMLGFLGTHPTRDQILAGEAALPRYVSSAVVTPDGRQALTSYGVAWRDVAADRGLMDDVRAALPRPPDGYTVEVSGLPVAAARGYDIVSGNRVEPNLVALCAAFVALLLLLPRRSDAVYALAVAIVATGGSLAVVRVVEGNLNPLTLALGALTAAVGAEFSVLLLTAERTGDRALLRSVRLAAVLSIGGYAVLLASGLPALRDLGLALVTSVVVSVTCAVLLTAVRARIVDRRGRRPDGDPTSTRGDLTEDVELQPTGGAG